MNNRAQLPYLPFVDTQAPTYPSDDGGVARRLDSIALILFCLLVLAGVGFLSQHVDGVISAASIILTLAGILALVCLVYAVSSLVYSD